MPCHLTKSEPTTPVEITSRKVGQKWKTSFTFSNRASSAIGNPIKRAMKRYRGIARGSSYDLS